jgi:Ca-activated chloride channel family protein
MLWSSSRTTTVFVIDHSDSVAPSMRAQADEYVRTALGRMPHGDQAAIIVFGNDAIVEQPPSRNAAWTRTTVAPPSEQTDIERALQLALAILPAETNKRIVLLSDGAETRGNAIDTANLNRAANVPIDTVSLIAPPDAEDVALVSLEAPAKAREGQQLRLMVDVESGYSTPAQLQLLLDRQPVLQTAVDLTLGINRIPISVPAPASGFHAWEARIDAPGDIVGVNNVQFGFSEIEGPPRILLIASAAERAANLNVALKAAQLNPQITTLEAVPTSLIGMDAYDVMVLVDVPFQTLPKRFVELLPVYVRELGRGLLMVGGEESFAAGGYSDTPIETMLPVTMRPRGIHIEPDVAIVLVIDRSGSMAGRKLDLAKEGAAQSFATLDENDQIGVIAFDLGATWVLPLQPKPSAGTFLQQVGSISPGGGTDLRPGLEQAVDALEATEAKIKHVVLLTDGQAARNYDDIAQQMREAGITLSTVGIEDYDPHLRQVAPATGGRFYEVQDLNDVPQIFFDESLRIARRGIVEKEFTPVATFPAPSVRDLQAVPPLYGYNAVTPKETGQVILQSDDGDPLLAQWQYGLGRAAVWTSDMKGQWAKDWVRWDRFGRFASQITTDLLPAPNIEGYEADTSIEGNALVLNLQAETPGAESTSGLVVVGHILGAAGGVEELALSEVEPGRYRGSAELPEAGVYRVQVLIQSAGGQSLGVVSTGAVIPPSAEYLQRDGNLALLNTLAQRTGGRVDVTSERVWESVPGTTRQPQPLNWPLLWLAALLWPIDIAVRRLWVPVPQLASRRMRAPKPVHALHIPNQSNLQRSRAQTLQRTRLGQSAVGTPGNRSASSNTESIAPETLQRSIGAKASAAWSSDRTNATKKASQRR